MSYLDQIPFVLPELVSNPEPRCPCLLLLDSYELDQVIAIVNQENKCFATRLPIDPSKQYLNRNLIDILLAVEEYNKPLVKSQSFI